MVEGIQMRLLNRRQIGQGGQLSVAMGDFIEQFLQRHLALHLLAKKQTDNRQTATIIAKV
jgi:hypothetical protein